MGRIHLPVYKPYIYIRLRLWAAAAFTQARARENTNERMGHGRMNQMNGPNEWTRRMDQMDQNERTNGSIDQTPYIEAIRVISKRRGGPLTDSPHSHQPAAFTGIDTVSKAPLSHPHIHIVYWYTTLARLFQRRLSPTNVLTV